MKIIISKDTPSRETSRMIWDLAEELAKEGFRQCSGGNLYDPPYVYLHDGEAKIGRDTEGGPVVCRFDISRTVEQNTRNFQEKLRKEPIVNYAERGKE